MCMSLRIEPREMVEVLIKVWKNSGMQMPMFSLLMCEAADTVRDIHEYILLILD